MRVLGEGDLFGVRAIEKGYYGGVAQSTANSVTNSPMASPMMFPADRNPFEDNTSSGSSLDEISLCEPSEPSLSRGSSQTQSSNGRLQPSDAELNGRRNHDPSVTPSIAQSFPFPSPPSAVAAPMSPEERPKLKTVRTSPTNSQVQSYAQWRLTGAKGHAKTTSRSHNKGVVRTVSGAALVEGPITQHTIDMVRKDRRKSRSMSSMDEPQQLQLLRAAQSAQISTMHQKLHLPSTPPMPSTPPKITFRVPEGFSSPTDEFPAPPNSTSPPTSTRVPLKNPFANPANLSRRTSRRRSISQARKLDERRSMSLKNIRESRDSFDDSVDPFDDSHRSSEESLLSSASSLRTSGESTGKPQEATYWMLNRDGTDNRF